MKSYKLDNNWKIWVTKSYEKLRNMSYRFDENRMFTSGCQDSKHPVCIKSITDVSHSKSSDTTKCTPNT